VTPDVRVLLALLREAPDNPGLVPMLLDWIPQLQELVDAPGGLRRWESVVTYIYTVNAGRIGIHDLDPVYDKLGAHAKEVAVTIAEQLEVRGEVRGRAETLIELLSDKFGSLSDDVTATIRAADVAALRVWTTRVLRATGIDEIFGR
jgi:hypothetical protein